MNGASGIWQAKPNQARNILNSKEYLRFFFNLISHWICKNLFDTEENFSFLFDFGMVDFVFSFRLHCSFHSPGSTMELCKSKPIIACETKFHKIECVRENAEKCYDFVIVLWIKSFFCDNYEKLMHETRAKYSIARYQSAFFPSNLETNLKTVTLKILLSTWNLGFSSHISLLCFLFSLFFFSHFFL